MIGNKGLKTKEKLIETAKDLFSKSSINDVTILNITSSAGLSKGSFYNYFDSKETLIWQIIESEIYDIFAIFEKYINLHYSHETIPQLVDDLVDYTINHKDTLKLVNETKFHGYVGKERIIKKYYKPFGIIGPIYKWLEKENDNGHFQINDLGFMTFFLTNVIDEMITEVVIGEIPYPIEKLRFNLKDIIRKILEVSNET